ncbi:MAG: PPC domain-containing DNA-binding protein [Verrucomicrobiota bacterium]
MATMKQAERGRVLIGKLEHGADLLEEITAICREADIRLGRVEAIGAIQKARLAYYDQQSKTYEFFDLDEPLEILNLTGNVSIKDGQPMLHAHVTLSNEKGESFGGHLAPGTIIFAGECIVEELLGPEYVRGHDETTGLPLWEI